jgi:hypothetical protein
MTSPCLSMSGSLVGLRASDHAAMGQSLSMIVALAMPPPSHMVCSP